MGAAEPENEGEEAKEAVRFLKEVVPLWGDPVRWRQNKGELTGRAARGSGQDSVRGREGETGRWEVGAAASGEGEAVWECGKSPVFGSCVQV